MKRRIHEAVSAKTKDEYDRALKNIENMIDLAKADETEVTKLRDSLYRAYVRTGGKDISTSAEHAKMLNQRINDKKELWEHQAKRQMMRDIRKLHKEGNVEEATKLEKQFKEKYARRR